MERKGEGTMERKGRGNNGEEGDRGQRRGRGQRTTERKGTGDNGEEEGRMTDSIKEWNSKPRYDLGY